MEKFEDGNQYPLVNGPPPRKGDTWKFAKYTIWQWFRKKGPVYKQNVKLLLKIETWKALSRSVLTRIIVRLILVHDGLIDLPYDLKKAYRVWKKIEFFRITSFDTTPKQPYQYSPDEVNALPKLNKAYADATMEFKSFEPFTDLKDGSKGVEVGTGRIVDWTPPPASIPKRGRKKKK